MLPYKIIFLYFNIYCTASYLISYLLYNFLPYLVITVLLSNVWGMLLEGTIANVCLIACSTFLQQEGKT